MINLTNIFQTQDRNSILGLFFYFHKYWINNNIISSPNKPSLSLNISQNL